MRTKTPRFVSSYIGDRALEEIFRAQQIWVILVGLAKGYSVGITYGALASKIGRDGYHRHLSKPLARIWHFCNNRGLPQLALLVINAQTGMPGSGAFKPSDNDAASYLKAKADVHHYDWYNVCVPTFEELQAEPNDNPIDDPE